MHTGTIFKGFSNSTNKSETIFQAPFYLDDFDCEKKVAILGENINIRKKLMGKIILISPTMFC